MMIRLRLKEIRLSRAGVVIILALGFPGALACSTNVDASPMAPAISRVYFSKVTSSSVVLYGYINPRGQDTNYYFQYGTSTSYGAQTSLSSAGNGTVEVKVSQLVGGLRPATTYHFRIVAANVGGESSRGVDHTFTTLKVPLSLQIAGIPNPVSFGSAFNLEGTLSGTGATNHAIVLQTNPFPYLRGFKTIGNPELTNAAGGFSFPVVGLRENAQLRVITVGKPVVSSPVFVENVAVRVVLHARHTHRRGFVRLYGTVTPAEVGALVGFQLLKPGHRSVNKGGTMVKPGTASVSRFSRVVRRRRGLYRALVKIVDAAHVSSYSPPILVR